LVDKYASDKRSDDVPYIHNIRDIPIDESDIFMIFSDDDILKYGTENTLKDITQSYQPDNHSHIIDEKSSGETQE